MFPSPYGEVGFDQCCCSIRSAVLIRWFPSPYGEVGFDHDLAKIIYKKPCIVSVPLRGSWF